MCSFLGLKNQTEAKLSILSFEKPAYMSHWQSDDVNLIEHISSWNGTWGFSLWKNIPWK